MKTMPSIGLLSFMALFFAVGFGVLGHGVWSLLQSNRAKSWPTTPGKVETCRISESTDSDSGTSYTVEVNYSYTVGNRAYAGNRIAFGYSGSSGRQAHAEIAAKPMTITPVTMVGTSSRFMRGTPLPRWTNTRL